MNLRLSRHIEACRRGEREAFGYLFEHYRRMVYTLAFRLLCDEQEAQDATQETFVKVWRQIARYDSKYRFSTWVYKIATHVCYDALRSRRRMRKVDLAGLDLSVEADERIDDQTLKALILKATEGLSPKQKLVFTLSELEQLEVDEITAITGLSPARIKSNLYLARKTIQEKLSRHEL